MEGPVVSIIIPVFNRSHLIGETLDSISVQTYRNWECIVVDDGSSDATMELLEFYVEREKRIKYYPRPEDRPKGANSCRNYGFEMSTGEYITWFDSDDIMLPNNLELKFSAFQEDVDFVIGNSLNFDEEGNNSRPYKINYGEEITAENFITGKIGWITNDVLIRKGKVFVWFNEELESGQEYNFFSRLLYFTSKGKFLKKDTVLRRVHTGSVHQTVHNDLGVDLQYLRNEVILLRDISKLASPHIIDRSLKRLIRFSYKTTQNNQLSKNQKEVLELLFEFKRFKVFFLYLCWVIINAIFGKGYFFIKRSYHHLDN